MPEYRIKYTVPGKQELLLRSGAPLDGVNFFVVLFQVVHTRRLPHSPDLATNTNAAKNRANDTQKESAPISPYTTRETSGGGGMQCWR